MTVARDFTVVKYGIDSSGRSIWMTRWMVLVFQAILKHPQIAPFAYKITVVQGAFMVRNGGGADASAGYHDQGGCIDIRTWNLTTAELDIFIKVARMFGFAFWRRDESYLHGGMDPHAHGTLGSDSPLSSGASVSWGSYVGNGDGLAGGRPDYEWRPKPLVLVPPDSLLQEDYLMSDAAQAKLDQIIKSVANIDKDLETFRTNSFKRDKLAAQKARESKAALVSKIGGVMDILIEINNKVDDPALKKQVSAAFASLKTALTEDPDVDGAENPA